MSTWNPVESEVSLHQTLDSSADRPVFILKHSYRCALSSMAKNRIEKNLDERLGYFLIDVIKSRKVSDALADHFSVQHESPQAFLVIDSRLIEVKSHLAIDARAFSVLLDSYASA